jgi:hypothetical protein
MRSGGFLQEVKRSGVLLLSPLLISTMIFPVSPRLILLIFSTVLALGWRGDVHRDQEPATSRPPNFIIVYADDLGYADIGPSVRSPET